MHTYQVCADLYSKKEKKNGDDNRYRPCRRDKRLWLLWILDPSLATNMSVATTPTLHYPFKGRIYHNLKRGSFPSDRFVEHLWTAARHLGSAPSTPPLIWMQISINIEWIDQISDWFYTALQIFTGKYFLGSRRVNSYTQMQQRSDISIFSLIELVIQCFGDLINSFLMLNSFTFTI